MPTRIDMTPRNFTQFKPFPLFLNVYCNEIYLNRYLGKTEMGCSKVIKLGNEGWGSWDICLSGPFALKEPCLIYSFGYVT